MAPPGLSLWNFDSNASLSKALIFSVTCTWYEFVIGYNCGDADGITGKKFDAAVKKYQTWMHHPDGEITAGGKTWKHLLGML